MWVLLVTFTHSHIQLLLAWCTASDRACVVYARATRRMHVAVASHGLLCCRHQGSLRKAWLPGHAHAHVIAPVSRAALVITPVSTLHAHQDHPAVLPATQTNS